MEAALRNIYEGMIDPETDIEPNLFKLTWDKINSAIDTAFTNQEYSNPDLDFIYELKHNAGVFAAFKTHKQQNELVEQLIGDDGQPKSFAKFKEDTGPWTAKELRYLETEYDTATLRARNAAKWKEFERDADLYPNLKWLPSTSAERREMHVLFYNMVLPIIDPFWLDHYPGDLWNCKCGITNTDEPVTEIPDIGKGIKPDPGLDKNPGTSGMLFTGSHPYIKGKKKLLPLAVKQSNKVLLKKALEVMNRWKLTIDPYKGKPLFSNTLQTGKLILLRNAVRQTRAHNYDPFVLISLRNMEERAKQWRYIGWAETLPGKHGEAAFWTYYEAEIHGQTRIINVRYDKNYKSEVFYSISDKLDKRMKIKKGEFPHKKTKA